jgi:hypothetical protein
MLEECVAGLPELVLERVDGLQPRAGGGERLHLRQNRHDPAVQTQPVVLPVWRRGAAAAVDGHGIGRESGREVGRWHWSAGGGRGC